MAATTFADLAETYVQGKKTVRSTENPTPEQLRVTLAQWAAWWVATGWAQTSEIQGIIDKVIDEYTDIWNGWFPPTPPPIVDSPLVYDFRDGSFMPSNASLEGKTLGDFLSRPEGTYVLKNFPSGINFYMPRWVKR